MFIAKTPEGKLIDINEAIVGEKYFCKLCNEELIIKCRNSQKIQTHFAHKKNSNCVEPWAQHDMSEWHKNWQNQFPKECQEVPVEKDGIKHIADVLFNNTVFEFQHSPISYSNFNARNTFYTSLGFKVVWVFDANNRVIKEEDNKYSFKYTQNQFENFDNINNSVAVYFENKDEMLLLYKNLNPNSFNAYTFETPITKEYFLMLYLFLSKPDTSPEALLILSSNEQKLAKNQLEEYKKKLEQIQNQKQATLQFVIQNALKNQINGSQTAQIIQTKRPLKSSSKIHWLNNKKGIRM